MIFRGEENSTGELGNFHPALTCVLCSCLQRLRSLRHRCGNAERQLLRSDQTRCLRYASYKLSSDERNPGERIALPLIAGIYHHDGLAAYYTPSVACEVLADCHHHAFQELLACTVEELVNKMEAYMRAGRLRAADFVTSWEKLEPYRVAVPVETERLASEFLFCNLKIALAILEARQHQTPVAPAA